MTADPIAILEAEHGEALAALSRMESAAYILEIDPDSEPDRRIITRVLGFLSSGVRAHNEKEERFLFPLFGEDSPAGIFEDQHRALRALEERLQRLLRAGDPATAEAALEIVGLLRSHIERENLLLFPLARVTLCPAELQALAANLAAASSDSADTHLL